MNVRWHCYGLRWKFIQPKHCAALVKVPHNKNVYTVFATLSFIWLRLCLFYVSAHLREKQAKEEAIDPLYLSPKRRRPRITWRCSCSCCSICHSRHFLCFPSSPHSLSTTPLPLSLQPGCVFVAGAARRTFRLGRIAVVYVHALEHMKTWSATNFIWTSETYLTGLLAGVVTSLSRLPANLPRRPPPPSNCCLRRLLFSVMVVYIDYPLCWRCYLVLCTPTLLAAVHLLPAHSSHSIWSTILCPHWLERAP